MAEVLYHYRPEAVEGGIEAILRTHNLIDTRLDNLEALTRFELVDWSNEAKVEYEVHKAEWDAAIDRMKAIMINNAIPALKNILANYQLTDRVNANMWNQG